ncbi:MAG TPA: EamA family transporter RarD [Rariglobus sp.]|jgi:chloramphenicol-sensitive protein RarD|nr:EamA family transporter RarD [Rariglobus sp.]
MTTPAVQANSARGTFAALGSYLCWGLFPLFWKHLSSVNAFELIAHRHVWSLVTVAALLTWLGGWREVAAACRQPALVGRTLAASVLLTGNWLIFVWGVNAGHVIECSLGYFLSPLANVLLGRFVLGEHLSARQAWALVLAGVGVGVLVFKVGHVPWIAFGIVATWAGYSLLKKKMPLAALPGFTLETLLLAPVALAFLAWLTFTGRGALGHVDTTTTVLILSSGVVTALPLLMFAEAARHLRLTTLGLLQYLVPTCQFLLGWLVYHERFTSDRALAFAFIWAGLALYGSDLLRRTRTSS